MIGAQFEISVDGKPRSYRDTKSIAMEAAEFLKSRNPKYRRCREGFAERGNDSGRVQAWYWPGLTPSGWFCSYEWPDLIFRPLPFGPFRGVGWGFSSGVQGRTMVTPGVLPLRERPMLSAEGCRRYSADCRTLRETPDLSARRIAILTAMARSWTALANQRDRYDALVIAEGE